MGRVNATLFQHKTRANVCLSLKNGSLASEKRFDSFLGFLVACLHFCGCILHSALKTAHISLCLAGDLQNPPQVAVPGSVWVRGPAAA